MPRRSPASNPRALYDVHPAVRTMQDWIATLKDKTGRSLDEWLRFIERNGPEGEAARRHWLKDEHGLGTLSAWWLAERSVGKGADDDDPDSYLRAAPRYVDDMYAPRPALRPIHDRLVELARSVGPDVRVCPCLTIVPIYRHHVVAQIRPATRTRLDFGLALGGLLKKGRTKFTSRLIDTGGFAKKDRITHRVALCSAAEVDDFVAEWTRRAYDLDA